MGRQYKALINGPPESLVEGWTYEIASKEYKETMMFYKTANYEVVRCKVMLRDSGEEEMGCTFRFVDEALLE